ncbi:MAG: YidH family protein [Parachlamydiaceae bacterium]
MVDQTDVNETVQLARERTDLARERNRLANERTFLAWIRTGLASVGGGLATIRFLNFQHLSHEIVSQIVGSVLVILGITIFLLSYLDYKKRFNRLELQSGYTNSIHTIGAISLVLIAISCALLIIAFNFQYT